MNIYWIWMELIIKQYWVPNVILYSTVIAKVAAQESGQPLY